MKNKRLSVSACEQVWRGRRLRCGDVFGVVNGAPVVFHGGKCDQKGCLEVYRLSTVQMWNRRTIRIKSYLGQRIIEAMGDGQT